MHSCQPRPTKCFSPKNIDSIFGIGDKLYKILIQVEPPEEDFDDDDLLDDDLEGNRKDAEETGPGVDDGNTTNSSKGGGLISSTSSLTSNKNPGPSSPTNSRQKTMEYLKQLPDPLSMDHTYSLVQEMELMGEDEDDEDMVNEIAEEEDL